MPNNYEEFDKRLTLLEQDHKSVLSLLSKIGDRLDDIHKYLFEGDLESKYINRSEYQIMIESIKKDVDETKSNQNKIIRIVITAVVTAVLGVILI